MTAKRPHLTNFDPNFIFSEMENWKVAAEKYDQAARQHYQKIRSYLTLYQFRLNDDIKCEMREKLAQALDEICSHDFVHDLDSYLEGFCFTLDKSVLPTRPNEVKIEIAQKPDSIPVPPNTPVDTVSKPPEISIDSNDFDYYTLQFFQ